MTLHRCWIFLLLLTCWLLPSPAAGGEIHKALCGYPKQDIAKAIALLIADPTLVHSRHEYQRTPLHIAARFGPLEMVDLLLELKSDVSATAYSAFTPTHLVSDGRIAKRLIEAGAKLDLKDSWGKTALQEAAFDGRMQGVVELVNAFLDAGADVNQKTLSINGDVPHIVTALTNAVWADKAEVVEVLLKHGARTDVSGGSRYETILDYARAHSSRRIVDLLEKATPSRPPVPRIAWETVELIGGVAIAAFLAVWLFWKSRARNGDRLT